MPRADASSATDGVQVVRHHLDAVRAPDSQAMVADYAPDAVLERPDRCWRGLSEINTYFATVAPRLAGGRVEFGPLDPDRLEVRWRIVGGPAAGTSGCDTYQVRDGRIAYQQVRLDGRPDF